MSLGSIFVSVPFRGSCSESFLGIDQVLNHAEFPSPFGVHVLKGYGMRFLTIQLPSKRFRPLSGFMF